MASEFIEFFAKKAKWLDAELSEGWTGVLYGLTSDLLSEGMSLAAKTGWILDPQSPDDTLPLFASERRLPRYPLETAPQHRARLHDAWQAYSAIGEATIVRQLELAGYPGAQIEFRSWFPGPLGEPAPYWSQFWVFFPIGTHPITAPGPNWGDFDWGDGTLFGPEGLTQEFVATISGIIKKWKPSRWICRGVVFELSEALWGEFDFDDGTVWGGRVEIGI